MSGATTTDRTGVRRGPRPARLAVTILLTVVAAPLLPGAADGQVHALVPYGEDHGTTSVADHRAAVRHAPTAGRNGDRSTRPDTTAPGRKDPAHPRDDRPGDDATTPPTGRPTPNADCRTAPDFPRQPRTRFGTSISTSEKLLPDSLADEEKRFGAMTAIRTYDPTIPPDGAWSRRAQAVGDRLLVHSFRMPTGEVLAGRHDAALRAWFSEAPTAPIIVWNYVHEPEVLEKEGSLDATAYRKAFRHVARIAGSLCRDNLFPSMILTGWTADERSGRDWRDYYAGDEYVSLVAWDPYNSASQTPTKYEDPETLFRHVVDASKETGKPFGIAETGSERIAGDEAGTRRAVWLADMAEWFADNGAQFVTYFQSTRDGNFILLDQPSVDAWSRWVARSHG